MKKKLQEVWQRVRADIHTYRWAAVAFLGIYGVMTLFFHAFCPLVILTGLPCPGCGTTRALIAFLTGHWGKAFAQNPCIFLWVAAAVYFAWNRYGKGRQAKGMLPLAGAIAAVMIIVYFFRMAVEFPGQPPMVFREDNMLGRIFPFYNDWLRRLFSM